ncbi:CE1759 family FMN reductase [Bifidobacterium sp. ESL0790]|uniref:CE1759 family FMN reductase n=1 Tax=Bifidobacterium sp. ESL0790 TaxID=2983233 RepID=UPI0023FA21B1|nr:CE1759 family FMN reductase [Bifidobacterium sp. ESL0790]WEV71987.1 NAD(P)H-dependent oxidoreductase [Bifidobacterium sp. ESL0790]
MALEETDIVALAAKAETGIQQYSLTVVNAGISEPSSTLRLANEVAQKTAEYMGKQGKEVIVTTVTLKDYADDIAEASITFKPSERLAEAIKTVTSSDGLIAASPIYKASYSGLFKEFWDVVEQDAIANMPVVLAATGGSDRHALVPDVVMRGLFAFFRAVPAATSLMATKEDFDTPELVSREERAASELGALMLSGVRHQAPVEPASNFNW